MAIPCHTVQSLDHKRDSSQAEEINLSTNSPESRPAWDLKAQATSLTPFLSMKS